MATQGRYFQLKLFLEGIESDVVSATVTAGIMQPCRAEIEIPPADSAHEILPRTLVHVFFLESAYETVEDHQIRRPQEVDPNDLTQWKLLFAGEVLGYGFRKVGELRNIVLSCQDFTSYWSAAQVYWGSGQTSLTSYKRTICAGAQQLHAGSEKVRTSSGLVDILRARPTSLPTLTGLLGGVVGLLEAATGVYDSPDAKSFRGVNDFMSQAELRLHLTRMIGASPDDDTSATFIDTGDMRSYLSRVTASVQSTASFLDLVQVLLGKIYHQWASVPAPPFIARGTPIRYRQVLPSGVKYAANAKVDAEYKKARKAMELIETRQTSAREERIVGNTSYENQDVAKVGKDLKTPDTSGHAAFTSGVLGTGFPDASPPSASGATSDLEKQGQGGQSHNKRAEELNNLGKELVREVKKKSGSDTRRVNRAGEIASGLSSLAQATITLNRINAAEADGTYPHHDMPTLNEAKRQLEAGLLAIAKGVSAPVVTKTVEAAAASRLHAFLMTPDLYMVPPPKCNVLFPDHYMSVQFSRGWLGETTRLWLYGRTTYGLDRKDMYFSPNAGILGGPSAKDALDACTKGVSFLMPHELYTGVVPALEGLGDNDVFKRVHSAVTQKDKKQGGTGVDVSGQALHSPQEHLQRAANYLFFAKRYESRSMHVEARFCPQVIVGLPLLLLDPLEGSKSRIDSPDPDRATAPRGTHYLGVVSSIAHTIRASGGASTSIELSKCRAHDEGADLFGQQSDVGLVDYKKRRRRSYQKSLYKRLVVASGSDAAFDSKEFLPPDDTLRSVGALAGKSGQVVTFKDSAYSTYEQDNGAVLREGFAPVQPTQWRARTTESRIGKKSLVMQVRERPLTATEMANTKWGSQDVSVTEAERQLPAQQQALGPAIQTLGSDQFAKFSGPQFQSGPAQTDETALPWGYEIDVTESGVMDDYKPLTFSFEQTATPPWFASIFLPKNIGTQYYRGTIGCDSVLDDPALVGNDVTAAANAETPGNEFVTIQMDDGQGGAREVQVPSDLLDQAATVKQAADNLAETWLALREANANVPLFVEAYTGRRYASIVDILGNQSPHFRPKAGDYLVGDQEVDGFHGNAYGSLAGLRDFRGEPLQAESLTKATSAKGQPKLRRVDGSADPRRERYARVLQYVSEVQTLSHRTDGVEEAQYAGDPTPASTTA